MDIAEGFLNFIGDATLVIHNAGFDMKFLNAELQAMGFAAMPMTRARDTLQLARNKYPGQPASLDALCRRFGVDNSGRDLHGALLDAGLLADVYFHLMGGAQPELFDVAQRNNGEDTTEKMIAIERPARKFAVPEDEAAAHAKFIETLGDKAIWKKSDAA
jgi:DNA polymerase-3 subunit epsilon